MKELKTIKKQIREPEQALKKREIDLKHNYKYLMNETLRVSKIGLRWL